MKRIISIILLLSTLSLASAQSNSSESLFPLPVPPDTLLNLQPRCDYILNRFWDRCNFERAFLKPDQFNEAFGQWIGIMPHASADTVHASIDALMARFVKSGPNTLKLAELAENWIYSDTSKYYSEEIFLPFAKAVVSNKKISKADKARFAQYARVIESSGLGMTVPDLPFVRFDGSKGNLADAKGSSVLLFFFNPDCDDCAMAKLRLSADYNASKLIDTGELKIVCLYPGDPADQDWKITAADLPEKWIVGAMPEADLYFDLTNTPTLLFLDKYLKVLAKGMPVDHYLDSFRIVNSVKTKSSK